MGIISRLKQAFGGKKSEDVIVQGRTKAVPYQDPEEISYAPVTSGYRTGIKKAERMQVARTVYRTQQALKAEQVAKRQKVMGAIRRRLTGYEDSGKPVEARLKRYGGTTKPTPIKMLRMQRIAAIGGVRVPYQGIYYQGKTGKIGRGLSQLQQSQKLSQIQQQNPQLAYAIESGQAPMPMSQQEQQIAQIQAQMPQGQQIQQEVAYSQPQVQVGSFNALKIPNPLTSMGGNQPLQVKPINPYQANLGFPTEAPVSNPQGDWFTEYDWMSGKQVLRRRQQDRMFQW